MSTQYFSDDRFARKVVRALLVVQILAIFLVIFFAVIQHISSVLIVFIILSLLFLTAFLWLYARYLRIPIVVEKRSLQRQASFLEKQIQTQTDFIKSAQRTRSALSKTEHDELAATLRNIQDAYINTGLSNKLITDADIPEVGPKLKARLATYHISSAAEVRNKSLSSIPGFGEAKSQAVFDWYRKTYVQLDSTKPATLSSDQTNCIRQKYNAQNASNDAIEHNAQNTKSALEEQFRDITQHLNSLSPIKFINYLKQISAANGIVAIAILLLLVVIQCSLGTGTVVGAIVASMPTLTLPPTVTLTPTHTITPTITLTSTITTSPTITQTPTVTRTPTLVPTRTRTRIPTATYNPNVSTNNTSSGYPAGATALCNDGTYSYSQHRQGTCSHHGGVAKWLQ